MGRSVWIDAAKCLSIFLVVLFHTNPHMDGYVFDFLRLLRMPLFFLIAGLLFNMDKWQSFGAFLRHRAQRLLVPYCWFSLFFYVLWLLVGRSMVGETEMAIHPLVPVWEFVCGRPNVVLGPYWFVTCLLSMQVLFYGLKRLLRSNVLIIVLSVGVYQLLSYFDVLDLPWCIDRAFRFMPYYALGNCFRSWIEVVPHPRAKRSTILSWICDNNIITLALQNYIIGFIKLLGIWLLGVNVLTTSHYSVNILITIVTIFLSLIAAWFINRYLPFMVGKKRAKGAS